MEKLQKQCDAFVIVYEHPELQDDLTFEALEDMVYEKCKAGNITEHFFEELKPYFDDEDNGCEALTEHRRRGGLKRLAKKGKKDDDKDGKRGGRRGKGSKKDSDSDSDSDTDDHADKILKKIAKHESKREERMERIESHFAPVLTDEYSQLSKEGKIEAILEWQWPTSEIYKPKILKTLQRKCWEWETFDKEDEITEGSSESNAASESNESATAGGRRLENDHLFLY